MVALGSLGLMETLMCPQFDGVQLLESACRILGKDLHTEVVPAEFRARVLALLKAGKTVEQIANELGLSHGTIYNWRRQDEIELRRASGSGLSASRKAAGSPASDP